MGKRSAKQASSTEKLGQLLALGLVKQVAETEFEVEMPDSNDPLHVVVLEGTGGGRRLECVRCRENGLVKRPLCERAVDLFMRRKRLFERRKNRPERHRKKHERYDAARREAPHFVWTYLRDLVDAIRFPEELDPTSEHWMEGGSSGRRRGRPPADPRDMLLAALVWVSHPQLSLTEVYPDVYAKYAEGIIRTVPSLNWPSRILQHSALQPILEQLIVQSAAPILNEVSCICIDGSGQRTDRAHQYREDVWGSRMPSKEVEDAHRYGMAPKKRRIYEGLHVASSPDVCVVVAATAGPGTRHDSKFVPRLLELTWTGGCRFDVVIADAAYGGLPTREEIAKYEAKRAIPFRSNETRKNPSLVWREDWDLYHEKPDEFDAMYTPRSLAEAMFSAIKERFGETLRCKTGQARWNEALVRVLRYNAGRVLQLLLERGITHSSMRAPGSRPPRPPAALPNLRQRNLMEFDLDGLK